MSKWHKTVYHNINVRYRTVFMLHPITDIEDSTLYHKKKTRKKREGDWLLFLTQCWQILRRMLLENGRKDDKAVQAVHNRKYQYIKKRRRKC